MHFNRYVSQIEINKWVSNAAIPGEMVTVAGWGMVHQGGNVSKFLQKLTIPIISNHLCNTCNIYNGKITSSMFCAGDLSQAGQDACQGDSGGPLTLGSGQEAILIGITSWGEGENDDI